MICLYKVFSCFIVVGRNVYDFIDICVRLEMEKLELFFVCDFMYGWKVRYMFGFIIENVSVFVKLKLISVKFVIFML